MADSEVIFAVQESREGGYEARALGHSSTLRPPASQS